MQMILSLIVNWLLKKLWGLAEDALKSELSKQKAEEHIKSVLGDYEKVLEDAKEKAKDGLTEEEKDEIRRKKIALEESLLNGISSH